MLSLFGSSSSLQCNLTDWEFSFPELVELNFFHFWLQSLVLDQNFVLQPGECVKIKIKLCFLNTMTFLNSVFSYPRIKVMILHTLTFLHGVFLFCLKVWFDLLGGGNACPGSRGKSVIGSWNSISSDTEIQFLETQIYNYFKDKNTISRNT